MKFDELFKLPPRTFGPPQVPYRPKEIPNLFWINFIYQCSECRSLTGWHIELPDGLELKICSTECLTSFSKHKDDVTGPSEDKHVEIVKTEDSKEDPKEDPKEEKASSVDAVAV